MTDIYSSGNSLDIKYVARTDVGLVRSMNEDNFIVSESVADDNWMVPKEHFSLGPVSYTHLTLPTILLV